MKPLTHDIILTQFDHHRLSGLLNVFRSRSAVNASNLHALELELNRARTTPAHTVPSDVVTMNSKVALRDLRTGERSSVTLVFPDAQARDGRSVPVLSPLGLALLGCRVGTVLDFTDAGCRYQLQVAEVEYQPEASGNFMM